MVEVTGDLELTLRADGPVLLFPEDTWRDDPVALNMWHDKINEAVGFQNPWGLLAMRPDGDTWVFGCTYSGIWECARWGTRVRLLFDPTQRWHDMGASVEEGSVV